MAIGEFSARTEHGEFNEAHGNAEKFSIHWIDRFNPQELGFTGVVLHRYGGKTGEELKVEGK